MEPILKTEKLNIVFNKGKSNEYHALKDVDVSIYPKEYVIFFGPSGSGKSTLLYSLLGLLKPSSGKILIKGRNYEDFSEKEINERTSRAFGIVFQQYNLLFSLNVLDNVTLPQVFLGSPVHERREKALNLLRRFGIEARAKQPPAMLSGGQQQRVAVCRALINDPEIILADEPVGNLDSESARIVMETLKNINVKDKKTVILVTHDPRYLPFADRVYFFKDAGIDHEERMKRVDVETVLGKKEEEKSDFASELEKIAGVRHALSLPELKACSLSNWIIEELTHEQRLRLEEGMQHLLSGKASIHDFFGTLDKPYSKGGVGLYNQTALALAKKVAHILGESHKFSEKSRLANTELKKHRLVKMLRAFLLEEHKGDLSRAELGEFEKAIDGRLSGKDNHQQFVEKLCEKSPEGGLGFSAVAAQRIAERMEIITSLAD